MQKILLPQTDLTVSRFIFGTAGLFNAGSQRTRQRILETAFDNGFSHFDTAPYYGFGAAERALKPFLARHPDVTVTTKVGIYSPGGEGQPEALIFARKATGRFFSRISRPEIDFSVARAKAALDASLRRLGRERIDLYMLHEPEYEVVQSDEWLSWLDYEVKAGRVKHFGIALHASRLGPFLDNPTRLIEIVQTTDSLDGREADVLVAHGRPLQITYGYVSDVMRRGGTVDVLAILTAAFARNQEGAIIVSTRKSNRLSQYSQLTAPQ